ncbi:class I SAM-dependent RNA methyltransferase [Lutibaculum baratangense]|uniref:Putative RNA methyltransferase protein n=1 Tax=Lutibaculum baratangense AMV1 TaxID=631454 RepID=V4RF15_9HYPH|nr:class I SAM-dependent RNA methyltransferase [Lutibaculum baratangense]ESR24746.1 putative RNA methyltransferase protein [Lutibaculum baratangense AMV1]
MPEILDIDRLGHRGDGIAATAEGELFVPFTLPGEQVEIDRGGERPELLRVVRPAAERIAPVCRHFGTCGGCQLQHLAQEPYLAFKRGLVIHALRQRGLEAEVDPVIAVPHASRRRVVFSARRVKGGAVLGYSERMSHTLVDVEECPILVPDLEAMIAPMRGWLPPLVSPKGDTRITVLDTQTGLDVAVEQGVTPSPRQISELAAGAAALRLARLSLDGETLILRDEPVISFDGIRVTPPPGAFLQASAASEAAMAQLVLDGVGKAKKVADLYCGIGTFALRLGRKARVTAVEASQAALDALEKAARAGQGTKPLATLRRDLDRLPLTAPELKGFDAVVFDPPRAGAKAQAEELARSSVRRVVAVSCNPATLARDLKILSEGGFQIRFVRPVDQFVFSSHIECVAALERG